jgi:hypothetical protein
MTKSLSKEQISLFHQQGYLVIREFYDLETQIAPILKSIYDIVGLCLKKHNVALKRHAFTIETFDHGYQQLIQHDRNIGGVIYDAVKQIPAFQRLVSCEQNEYLFMQLRDTNNSAIAAGGSGIRIDNPREVQYQAPWHQEFPAQLRSLDGLIYWSPLRKVTTELGPVEICADSQQQGIIPVLSDSDKSGKTGAYALRLQNEENVVAKYSKTAPLSNPGDLILMDWLVLHRSGSNVSCDSRWTMQMRYFNFIEATGISLDWQGSFAAGLDFGKLIPELIAKHKDSK